MTFWALIVDGLHICGEVIMVAIGVTIDGKKHILGISQGSTENAEIVKGLLAQIAERGICFTEQVLAVTDGAKALRAALIEHFGERVSIQRCLIHKKRNVIARLAKKHHREFSERITQAYNCNNLKTAESEMRKVETWLDEINHNAAESLREGFDNLLTLHRLGMPPALRVSFYTTNIVESAFANPRAGINRVKRWRKDSDMIKRWIGAHLLRQEQSFRRVKGHKLIPGFLEIFAGIERNQIDEEHAA